MTPQRDINIFPSRSPQIFFWAHALNIHEIKCMQKHYEVQGTESGAYRSTLMWNILNQMHVYRSTMWCNILNQMYTEALCGELYWIKCIQKHSVVDYAGLNVYRSTLWWTMLNQMYTEALCGGLCWIKCIQKHSVVNYAESNYTEALCGELCWIKCIQKHSVVHYAGLNVYRSTLWWTMLD